jgi:hypothetical protein
VEIEEVLKHIDAKIAELERQVYDFEHIEMPKHKLNVDILAELRSQVIKMEALVQRKKEGVPITSDDVHVIPKVFR